MPNVITYAFGSKKFLAFVVALIVTIGNWVLSKIQPGSQMDPAAVYAIVIAAAGYAVGQGIDDHGSKPAQKAAQLGAAQAMAAGPDKDAALKTLAGISPANINAADTIKASS